jgi:flagellar hook-associated protein 3 FlgL
MFYLTSTYTINTSLRRTIVDLQSELARGQKELASGRHADLGVALGMRAARAFSVSGMNDAVQTILSTNKLVGMRLESTQTALASLKDTARNAYTTLLAALNDGGDRAAIETQARAALGTFVSTLNSSDGEAFLFGGINSGAPPINDYFATPPSANKIALDAAFMTFFGFPQTSPAVSGITPAQIQAFLDGPMSALFSSPAWNADWSNASDQPLRSQISVSLTIESSVSANDPALQKLAMAYAVMSDLGAEQMSAATYRTVLQNASKTIDQAVRSLTKTQARVGVMQRNLNVANETMAIQSGALQSQMNDLEGIDPTEAATRVNGLMTQIETAYSLTAKISQLSLTRYL